MRLFRFFYFVLTLTIFFNCSSKKDLIYIQDIDETLINNISYSNYQIKVDDILKIDVATRTIENDLIYNMASNKNITGQRESLLYYGYQVNKNGYINFPEIGLIEVVGLTTDELNTKLYNLLVESDQLVDPIIDIKILNSSFTILGEVNKPGKYEFLENNLNLLEAIGYAGDLTITGKRNDIKIIREIDKNLKVFSVDLTNSNFIKDNFQIFSGDIIVVNPNTNRVKNAGIIGNSGTLLSLLSFLLSSIIIINN